MSEESAPTIEVERDHMSLPFRLGDIELSTAFEGRFMGGRFIDTVRREWLFQFRLARAEWTRDYYVALLFGTLALLFGSVSPELLSGGDAALVGVGGVMAISGFQYFQLLISVLLWCWFVFQGWQLFPVMRTHLISLVVLWNGLMLAQIFFHSKNATFPSQLNLADMMEGTLLYLVVFFFMFYFWKAVVETRDLHVEINHVHEDVRVMEAEMAEHSLTGWTIIFAGWLVLIITSTWAGVHHVAELNETNIGALVLHLITGVASLPIFFFLLWYPQRMLGQDANVTTRAAIDAALEMAESTSSYRADARCPDCEAPSPLTRTPSGEVAASCLTTGCNASVVVGMVCDSCKNVMPTRLQCTSCGVNAPAMDYFPDQEAW